MKPLTRRLARSIPVAWVGGAELGPLLLIPLLVFGGPADARTEPLVGPSGVPVEPSVPSDAAGGVTAPPGGFGFEGGADVQVLLTNEPAIAVNPLDPNNIAVADLIIVRVSTDNGATFSSLTLAPLPPGYSIAGDPSLAFNSQGQLFWSYLGRRSDNENLEVFIAQIDPTTGVVLPGYPVNVSASAGFPGSDLQNLNDKEWLAADRFPASPFRDRLYVVWTRFGFGTFVHATYSDDQGLTWSPALTLSGSGEGFVWPVHNAVAPNGDLYVAYHSLPFFRGGQVFVLRSSDGGVSFSSKTTAFAPGDADITFNVQGEGRELEGSVSWTQGSAQAWVLPDPVRPDHVYVVAADDPTDSLDGVGFDDMNVYIVRSMDAGTSWSAPVQIDMGPVGTTQSFPTAGIADGLGCLTIAWWDTRAGATNSAGNLLLDFFTRSSSDGGITFGPEVQLNDVPFDPDFAAVDRFPPTGTLRIGEYNGVAVPRDTAHAVWTGNGSVGQAGFFDSAIACEAILIEPDIDIKPGSDLNSVRPGKGTVSVAVLGSATFNVTELDVSTLAFGPDGAAPKHNLSNAVALANHLDDVNGDGFRDLLSHYRTKQTGIGSGSTKACLSGQTSGGTSFEGCDAVSTE